MADPAAELGAQCGDAGAEVGADALAGDDQVQAERGTELSQPQEEDGAQPFRAQTRPRLVVLSELIKSQRNYSQNDSTLLIFLFGQDADSASKF
ncbi:hypothetical protein GCM10017557_14450 [Streptomyces aurantiacus]|uniref:Uncharacterized protein n=1 Tax=Streptomyces aurantiacus TaxID=47760 RepID=A0A7G1NYH8_9ACTN|nr:hypothetical protein GCM10017557_14450 [Streptomyces aurantiacus]